MKPPLDPTGLTGENVTPQTALLSIYTTREHTYILGLKRQTPDPQLFCHRCEGEGWQTLQNWLLNTWVNPYTIINNGETDAERIQRRQAWHAAMPATLAELARRLRLDDLIGDHLQGIEELIVLPHLFLHQIPLTALPVGNSESPSEPHTLNDRFRLRYAPSTLLLQTCQQRPALDPDALGIVENTTEDLIFTPLECELVAQQWHVRPEHRLRGKSVTPDTYRQLLGQVPALLSSHHAESSIDDPLTSHLILGNGQRITLRDLFTPVWRFPDLGEVFLSCCETGLSFAIYQTEKGELSGDRIDDPLSIGAGFLIAGARSVIGTHWEVNERATTMFSYRYHRERKAGNSPLSALRNAQSDLRTGTRSQWLEWLDRERKSLSERREAATEDSDTYQHLRNMRIILDDIRYWLEKRASDRPFSNPEYWAAFYCLGMG